MGTVDNAVEEMYQSRAIGLLIPLLSTHSEPWRDETLLATTVILRMSEQFSEVRDDAQHHLKGAFSLFGTSENNRWSPFQADVRGTAFWIYLRESIRICFLYEQGCQFDMGLIEDETFEYGPDEAWANRMTYLLARTCNACWGEFQLEKAEEMTRLLFLIESWRDCLPESFQPWCSCESKDVFPTVRFSSTWHVIGWQQHYTAKVMLAFYAKPQDIGANYLVLNQYMQSEVLGPARQLCGVCFSCEDIGSEINGSHLIAWCGQFFSAKDERCALMTKLNSFMEKTTWPNRTCSERLQRIWKDEQRGWTDEH